MNNKLIKLLCLTLSIIFSVALLAFPVSAESDIRVMLDGEELIFDVPPQIISERTMVPMRAIFEALGAEVNWDEVTQTITATQDDTTIIMQIDNAAMSINAATITLDVSPTLIGARTLVPVRAVAEGLDADVRWDAERRTVVITRQEQLKTYAAAEIEVFDIITDINNAVHATRYFFEQQRLPKIIFENQEELRTLINTGDSDGIKELVLAEWERVSIGCVAGYLLALDNGYSQANVSMLAESTARKRAELGLGEGHIVSASFEQVNPNTNVVVVEMYYTNLWRLSSFIAIVYNEDDGLKYFTLERSIDGSTGFFYTAYIVCLTTPAGRIPFFQIDNNRDAFIYSIGNLTSRSLASELNLRATVTVMNLGEAAMRDIEQSIHVSISLYNSRGENVTSHFRFGRIELVSNAQIIDGDIVDFSRRPDNDRIYLWTRRDHQRPFYYFNANWSPGDLVNITVEAGHYSRDFIEFGVLDVEIVDMTEMWENRDHYGRVRIW